MTTRPSKRILVILVIFFGFMTVGCGSKSGVSGRVTVDGQPLESGFVTFFPDGPVLHQYREIEGGGQRRTGKRPQEKADPFPKDHELQAYRER